MDVSCLLSASVTPKVLISACGLIVLALYNRLGAILARLRTFHQQKLGLLKDLAEREAVVPRSGAGAHATGRES